MADQNSLIITIEKIKNEISGYIQKCESYQKSSPDVLAAERVKKADENLCDQDLYYVVSTYSSPNEQTITDPEIIKKYKVTDSIDNLTLNSIVNNQEQLFLKGFIIILNLNEKTISISDPFTDFNTLMSNLLMYYKTDKYIIKDFNPRRTFKKLSTSKIVEYLESDWESLSKKYTHVIYALGHFKSPSKILESLKNSIYEKSDFNIENISFLNLIKPSVLNDLWHNDDDEKMLFINFCKGNKNKDITGYEQKKSKLEYLREPKDPGFRVFDLGNYFLQKIKNLEDSDKIKYYSTIEQTNVITLNSNTYLFELYKFYGGQDDKEGKYWGNDWKNILNQYEVFKQAFQESEELKKSILSGNNFIYNNLKAVEFVNYLKTRNEKYLITKYQNNTTI